MGVNSVGRFPNGCILREEKVVEIQKIQGRPGVETEKILRLLPQLTFEPKDDLPLLSFVFQTGQDIPGPLQVHLVKKVDHFAFFQSFQNALLDMRRKVFKNRRLLRGGKLPKQIHPLLGMVSQIVG